MGDGLTRAQARNIFYGGSIFFLVMFVALVVHSHFYALSTSSNSEDLTESVERGKRVWEEHACINCHTILGEGAYFAPELGNVWVRYGGLDDAEGAREGIIAWMESMPSGVEGRRQMPNFNLSEQDLNDLVDFLEWTSRIDTQGWPPNEAG